MTTPMQVTRKTIFITGISRGLGHGLATACLERGDVVLGLGRNAADDLSAHANFQFARADVTKRTDCSAALEKLLGQCDRLDCVILNAGVLGKIADMSEQSVEAMSDVMNVNLWANKVLLDLLLERGCSIRQVVAISSGASVNGSRGWGGYSLSKAALNMLVKLYAREREEIHFSALAPGLIDTGMQDQICSISDDSHLPSVASLKQARGTDAMPDPATAGKLVMQAIDRLPGLVESGAFSDVRKSPLAH